MRRIFRREYALTAGNRTKYALLVLGKSYSLYNSTKLILFLCFLRLAVHLFFVYHALLGNLTLAVVETVVPQRFELTPDLFRCK